MQIERTSRRSTILSSVAATSIATKKLVLILLLYTVVLAGAGAVLVKSGMIGRVIKPALFEGPVIAYNYLRGQTTQPERMVIDVKHKHFQKLAYNREIAVQRMHLFPDYRDEVPAVVRYGDTQTRVKMRLKGGGRDHFLHKYKWSFRIQTRGEQTLFGMKRFSIQQPKSRNYVYEWLFHEVAKREGLLALRYYFIEVVLNGKNLGVYALEEHFDKRLLEHNGRREGPIIKFDETNWQMERMHFDYANWRELPESGNYYSLPIDMFMTNTILADSTLSAEFGVALNLLERFRLRELRTSQIFDVDRLAKYLALCDLFGTHHPLHTNQLRFYYNPITSRLEPICFDTNSGNPAKKLSFSIKEIDDTAFDGGGRAFVLPNMFEDPEFFEAYVKALERFSERTYLDTLLHDFGDELQHNVRVIHREFPRYRFSPKVLYHNQEYIKTFLSPSKGLHAHFAGSDQESIKLEVANIQQIP
ncbi:MAG: CotH kinase family protein, partial [Candidatus Krumholzibacteria bacterium]|nr:CotH kinase family protein [Candidatus Krumholzibacteria bacterium]